MGGGRQEGGTAYGIEHALGDIFAAVYLDEVRAKVLGDLVVRVGPVSVGRDAAGGEKRVGRK